MLANSALIARMNAHAAVLRLKTRRVRACGQERCALDAPAWRVAGKHFRQEKNCEKVVFGFDDVLNRDADHPGARRSAHLKEQGFSPVAFWLEQPGTLIITEGEMDKLACNQARLLVRTLSWLRSSCCEGVCRDRGGWGG
jgi:hypothetical protein